MSIADKLQKLIDGKQYVVDKVNAKTGSNFTIDSKWEDIGDNVGTYEGGGSGTNLKPYLDMKPTAGNSLFSGLPNLTTEQLREFLPNANATENITSMYNMFSGCTSLTEVPQLDTSKATNMERMFAQCNNLIYVPQLNTTQVTNMKEMFVGCDKLTEIPPLDTSNVTNMSNMFKASYAKTMSITTIPQLDTSKVTNMNSMFHSCSLLTTIPPLDTSKVTDMQSMFNNCHKLETISQLDTSSCKYMQSMFYGCYELTEIPQLDTSSCTNMSSMFGQSRKLKKIDISHYNISSTSNVYSWCYECYSLKAVIIRSFGENYVLNSTSFGVCYHMLGTKNNTYNPNGDHDGYVYVPREYISILQNATNWSVLQFRALEDYTKDGTTTGEFDDEKAGL